MDFFFRPPRTSEPVEVAPSWLWVGDRSRLSARSASSRGSPGEEEQDFRLSIRLD